MGERRHGGLARALFLPRAAGETQRLAGADGSPSTRLGASAPNDRARSEARAPRRAPVNLSPWTIGLAHYDQRDLYTANASVEDDGYARGPSYHPEEGSYAYHREFHPGFFVVREGNANLYEREAWPWLNYTASDPYLSHLNAGQAQPAGDESQSGGFCRRSLVALKAMAAKVARALRRSRREPGPAPEPRTDAQLRHDVESALLREDDLDARDIAADVIHAEATLEGTVPDRRSRRAAGRAAARVPGVRAVHNRLEIRRDETAGAGMVFACA